MTTRTIVGGLASMCLALAACGDDDVAPPGSDAGPSDAGARDAGPAASDAGAVDAGSLDAGVGGADAGPASDAGGGAVDAGGGAGCGTMRPDVSGIRGTEGLVIARDGTIYYSQARAVGRLVPGGTPENAWAGLGASAGTVWGLALDATNAKLYAGSPSANAIFRVDVATAAVDTLLPAAGSPNGLTMGPDGALWYSDFGGGHVYRVDVTTGVRTMVTATTISGANGVAFGPDGRLYVDSYGSGRLFALTLTGTTESGRAMIANSLGNPDGVTFDASGRIYVTDNVGGRLIRLNSDGTGAMMLRGGIANAANVEFGVGALPCTDLYVASGASLVRYEMGTTPGAAVPWH